MLHHHTGISSHYFHRLQTAAEGSVLLQDKALRPDPDHDLPVSFACRQPFGFKNPILTHIDTVLTELSLQYIDRRISEELCHKKIFRIVIDFLRLPDLLQNTVLHDHHAIRNAHGFFLIVRHENRSNSGLLLNTANLRARLKAQSRIQV